MQKQRRLIFAKEVLFLLGENTKKLPFFVILFLFSSILDLIGIGLIAPYVSLISNQETQISITLYSWLSALGIEPLQKNLLIFGGAALVAVFLIKSICAIIVNKTIVQFSFEQGVRLRTQLMIAYQQMPYTRYLERNSSEYIYHIQQLAANYSQGFIQYILRLSSEGIVAITIIAFLAWKDWFVLSILGLLLGGSMLIYDRYFKNNIGEYGRLVNLHATKMLQAVHEGIEGLKEVRILGKEKLFFDTVKSNAVGNCKANVKLSVISTAPRQLSEFILVVFAVSLVVCTILLNHDLETLLPTLSVFGVAAIKLVPSANQILLGLTNIRQDRHSISLLYSDLSFLAKKGEIKSDPTDNESFRSVELKDVVFSYPNAKGPALNNVSLKIKAGECIGLVGHSGAGKTTLVDVLLGLLIPQSGEVIFNGVPINEKIEILRSQVGYLPQQAFLIDNTLEQNIALDVEQEPTDKDKLLQAIEQARLTDLVARLPQGVRTIIGERGIQLSGGQRQRVALARSFYHSRNLLVMDESTSALDSETESEVIEQMVHLKGNKTMIVIAHRLTTLSHCDRIYRLENGKIIEQCTYEQLMKNSDQELEDSSDSINSQAYLS